MKREHLAFLIGGLAFGTLFGFGIFHAVQNSPDLDQVGQSVTADRPMGPRAPTDSGARSGAPSGAPSGAAPMIERINVLKQRLQQDPADLEALVELADFYHRVSMWEQAAGYYQRALAIEQNHPDLLTNLGMCYRGMREFEQALEMFRQAHREHPDHWQSLFNIAITAGQDTGRYDEAFDALEALETLDPAPAELDSVKVAQLRQWLEAARRQAGIEGQS